MSAQDCLVLVAAASFFLIGIAISPLAWLALRQRRDQNQQLTDQRLLQQSDALQTLHSRVAHLESLLNQQQSAPNAATKPAQLRSPLGGRSANSTLANLAVGSSQSNPPTLIAIPKLASTSPDSDTNQATLAERYADIWSLADTGSSAEAIARATGQHVGQVELILALRRQIPGPRPVKPHTPHA